jgi:hypothetical protein
VSALTKVRNDEEKRWSPPHSLPLPEQGFFPLPTTTTCAADKLSAHEYIHSKLKNTATVTFSTFTCPVCDHADVFIMSGSLPMAVVLKPISGSSCVVTGVGREYRSQFDIDLMFSASPALKRFLPRRDTTDPIPVALETDSPLDPSIVTTLKEYEQLKEKNWDGYDGDPITKETLDYARKILRAMPKTLGLPEISPGADGSVALEWHPVIGLVRKLFLDIGPGEHWRAYWKQRDGKFDRMTRSGFDKDTKRTLERLFQDLSK